MELKYREKLTENMDLFKKQHNGSLIGAILFRNVLFIIRTYFCSKTGFIFREFIWCFLGKTISNF